MDDISSVDRGLVIHLGEKIDVGFISAAKTIKLAPSLWKSVGN